MRHPRRGGQTGSGRIVVGELARAVLLTADPTDRSMDAAAEDAVWREPIVVIGAVVASEQVS